MGVVGGEDEDGVDVGGVQHVPVVLGQARPGERGRRLLADRAVGVGERDDLRAVARPVREAGERASQSESEDTEAEFAGASVMTIAPFWWVVRGT